jgi:tetratricopeptide (TPR) repeat protein
MHIVMRIVWAVAVLVVLWGPPAGAQEPASLLQQAAVALENQDYAGAAQALEAYLPGNPEDFRAEFNLAYAYSMMGRRTDAITHYKNVAARQPEIVPARLNLGILLVEGGQAAAAVEHLQFVAEREPGDFRVAIHLARALAGSGRLAEAGGAYEKALQLKPDDVEAHEAYAKLVAEGDPALAERHLRSVLKIDPTRDAARLLLAAVLEARAAQGADTLDEAAALYQKYLEAHPQTLESNNLRVRLGQIYWSQQKAAEAVAQWEAAWTAGDESAELERLLLDAYLKGPEPQRDKASELVDRMLTRNETDAELWMLAGRLRLEKREYEPAGARFLRAAQLRPDWAEAHVNLASTLFLMKQYEPTLRVLARVAELGQDTAGTHFLRAVSHDHLHHQEEALENYERFLALDEGKNPDQEFQARQRIRILSNELRRRRNR